LIGGVSSSSEPKNVLTTLEGADAFLNMIEGRMDDWLLRVCCVP
jgi:hypothetical protein